MTPLGTRLLNLVVILAVGGIPVAPPEHVHEAEEHGHAHLLVHRHLAAHTSNHHDEGHDGVVDDEDTPILTADAVYTVPGLSHSIGEPPASRVVLVVPPVAVPLARHREYVERLIHGPPRAPTGLRAPPLSSRL